MKNIHPNSHPQHRYYISRPGVHQELGVSVVSSTLYLGTPSLFIGRMGTPFSGRARIFLGEGAGGGVGRGKVREIDK